MTPGPWHRALGTVAAASAAALLTGCNPSSNEVPVVPAATLGPVSCAPTGTNPKPATVTAPASGPFAVQSVVDGDTIRIDCNGESTRVRLVGIDRQSVV